MANPQGDLNNTFYLWVRDMAYSPEYYAENRERHLAYFKKYREKYPEKEKARHKKYRQENKEKHAEYERKRRAIKRNLPHEKYSTEDVIRIYGNICFICNKKIDLLAERRSGRKGWENGLHIDHLVSISKGGSDTIDNVRPTHGICNLKKNRYSFTARRT